MGSEKALRECNVEILSKIKVEGEQELPLCLTHYEDLICPLTCEKFGRPVQLYPISKAEIGRAREYQISLQSKKKDKKSKKRTSDKKSVKFLDDEPLKKKEKPAPQPKQKYNSCVINMPDVQKVANEVADGVNDSKDIEKYRKLKLIGDTSQRKDESA